MYRIQAGCADALESVRPRLRLEFATIIAGRHLPGYALRDAAYHARLLSTRRPVPGQPLFPTTVFSSSCWAAPCSKSPTDLWGAGGGGDHRRRNATAVVRKHLVSAQADNLRTTPSGTLGSTRDQPPDVREHNFLIRATNPTIPPTPRPPHSRARNTNGNGPAAQLSDRAVNRCTTATTSGGGGTRTPKRLPAPHFECGALPVRTSPPCDSMNRGDRI